MNLHVFQHVNFEGSGRIAAWALDRAHRLTTTHFYRDKLPPDMANVDGLIIMGGPMNVHETEKYPWLQMEKKIIKQFLATEKPILGICLGAQLLADALGSKVFPHTIREIGWWPVNFTADARQRFSILPASISVLHWHGDTYELPYGACRFAQSEGCAEQGFRLGQHVLALQFHIETGLDECLRMVEHAGADLAERGPAIQTAEAIVEESRRHSPEAAKILYSILDEHFKTVPSVLDPQSRHGESRAV
jgi:GMP synthase-like glutamine amidotransferase